MVSSTWGVGWRMLKKGIGRGVLVRLCSMFGNGGISQSKV